jgi:hypothetical protein
MPPKVAIAESGDRVFATNERDDKIQVISTKEIEAAVISAGLSHGTGNTFHMSEAGRLIIKRREKLEVTPIGCTKELGHNTEAVNRFAHGREFHRARAIAMFHLSAVLKKS